MTTKRKQEAALTVRKRGRPRKDRFSDLIPPKRPTALIHPERAVTLGPPLLATPDTSAVDEQSSYHEFAWEFLRRNRFFQALQDGKKGCPPVEDWGYEWHPQVPRTHGVLNSKAYSETYDEGLPPRWAGLDDFAQQLPTKPLLEERKVEVILKPGQVLVVYDLSGLIYGQSPLSPQLWATHDHLEKIAKRPFTEVSFYGKPMHRAVLLRRLKLFDAMNSGLTLAEACEELQYRFRGKPPSSPSSLTKMAESLASGSGKKGDPVTTGFEDANAAYDLVYRHGYLGLLLGEKAFALQDTEAGRSLVSTNLISRRKASDRKSKRQVK